MPRTMTDYVGDDGDDDVDDAGRTYGEIRLF